MESLHLVTVFANGDPTRVAVAKLVLRAEGIPFITKGEGVQDLFGVGRLFGGLNLVTGPVQIQVREEDAAAALQALEADP
jgi:hypothetical protein